MDRQTAISSIESHVAEQGRLTGSKLNSLLRKSDAEWTPTAHGTKTLAAFIAAYVPRVTVVGRAGLDPVYGFTNAPAPVLSGDRENLWRVWASPNSPLVLELNDNGQIEAVDRGQPPRAGWTRVHTPTAEDHRAIARDFITLQFPDGEPSLARAISESPNWWHGWFKQIRQRHLNGVWTSFRMTRLLSTFDRALTALELADGVRELAIDTLGRSASPGGKLRKALATQLDTSGTSDTSELRSIAAAAIERMNEQELATLRLPLGLVVSAIKNAR